MKTIIEITKSENCGYCIEVNGVAVMECLAQDEVEALTVKDIIDLVR
ncbi:MAG: hypothetical protein IKL46_04745 [Clostridia bacterium]|nr:hypothetical protein [Clostridia bacterium]